MCERALQISLPRGGCTLRASCADRASGAGWDGAAQVARKSVIVPCSAVLRWGCQVDWIGGVPDRVPSCAEWGQTQ